MFIYKEFIKVEQVISYRHDCMKNDFLYRLSVFSVSPLFNLYFFALLLFSILFYLTFIIILFHLLHIKKFFTNL